MKRRADMTPQQHAAWLARVARYRAAHRTEKAADDRRYRAKHAEKRRAADRAYSLAHPDKRRSKDKAWRLANLDRYRELARARQARYLAQRLQASGTADAQQIKNRWAMWGGRCYICGEVATETDHVKPLALGGSNWPANLRPICRSCNARKGGRLLAA